MVFCNQDTLKHHQEILYVTILILIDGFLQLGILKVIIPTKISHNPYFNRWFSAIKLNNNYKVSSWCHNPYFNRWFSAISGEI